MIEDVGYIYTINDLYILLQSISCVLREILYCVFFFGIYSIFRNFMKKNWYTSRANAPNVYREVLSWNLFIYYYLVGVLLILNSYLPYLFISSLYRQSLILSLDSLRMYGGYNDYYIYSFIVNGFLI